MKTVFAATLLIALALLFTNPVWVLGKDDTQSPPRMAQAAPSPPSSLAATATSIVSSSSQPVTVTTDRPSYALNEVVPMTASVQVNGAPVSGARVVITVQRPDGSVAGGMTPRTGTDGTATASFRPRQAGTYQVTAVADKNGVALGAATTSFMVRAGGDTSAPSIPSGLTAAAASCSQINLAWAASTDTGGAGLKGYNVYRGGVFLKQVTTPSTSDTGLAASTNYPQ